MIADDDLAELERVVEEALRTGDASRLRILGRGEISLVLGSTLVDPAWACKRLPPFPSSAAADRYTATLDRYTAELARRGVEVLETDVRRLARSDGTVVLYCVQPVLPAGTLAVQVARARSERVPSLIGSIVDAAFAATDKSVGLDAQLSNWAVVDDRLTYFDVTTPLLRRPDGSSELDTEVFLASLPWALRAAVRRFVLPGIIERYHHPRSVVLDLAANLVKERLDDLIPIVLDSVDGRVEPALTEDEVRRDYRNDARTWAALQSVRRADREWQRRVRRRPYAFLLPGRLER